VPLQVAQQAGYFDDAGFDEVVLVDTDDALGDLGTSQVDLAVVDSRTAAAADPSVRAIAGFQNYAPDGTYGGVLLAATQSLVADEPTTIIAFLTAYIRALQDLSDPASAQAALAALQAADPSVDPGIAETWTESSATFAPFDGGFGSVEDEGGLGELDAWLADGGVAVDDLSTFVAADTLNIAQALVEVEPNPVSTFLGAPGITDIRIGIPSGAAGSLAIQAAIDGGYLTDAGFGDVQVLDVQEPLLGVLNGELEFAVVDASTAADGVAQGLPLVAIAGHDNAAGERDLLVASADLVGQEGPTVAAFLIAYLHGLADLATDPNATAFAPFDGGYGDRAVGGGLGELGTDLSASLDAAPDLGALVATEPLGFAQAWWGLPANPVPGATPAGATPAGATPAGATPTTTEETS
jgi:hypothetical protein